MPMARITNKTPVYKCHDKNAAQNPWLVCQRITFVHSVVGALAGILIDFHDKDEFTAGLFLSTSIYKLDIELMSNACHMMSI